MPAPSLLNSCMKVCIKNVRTIKDVGSLEYRQIKPLLRRIESPEQLHIIETNCPQIKGEDAELWQKLIARDVPTWHQKNYLPKNPTKWYEVYCKYRKEQKLEIARDQEILRETMSGLKKKREENTSKVMDLRALPKVPRDPGMRANNGGVPLGKNKAGGKVAPSTLNWTSGSKTKMVDGKSVLTRARREAKEISQMGKLSRPTQELRGRAGQVVRAPVGMVKEYKTASQPQHIRVPSRKPNGLSSRDPGQASTRQGFQTSDLEEREERLRAAMGTPGISKSKRDTEGQFKQTVVAFSDDDDDDDNSLDDLFDEPPSPPDRGTKAARTTSSDKITPSSGSRPTPASSSATWKPSDIISSIVSGRPQQKSAPSSRSAPNNNPAGGPTRPSSRLTPPPVARHQTQSPQPAGKPMMLPKRKPVDIFNRKPKRPRVT